LAAGKQVFRWRTVMKAALKLLAMAAVAAGVAACEDTYGPEYAGPGPYAAGPGPYGDEAGQRWRHRYDRTYTYNDDAYYQQCRNGPDPAGVIAGGLIGGLVG